MVSCEKIGYDSHTGSGYMDVKERITSAFSEFSERSTRPRQVIAEGLIHLGETGEAFSADDLLSMLKGPIRGSAGPPCIVPWTSSCG